MRVLHVITGLNLGGAEVMLHRLLRASSTEGDVREVISLTDLGVVAERIERLGVRARALEMSKLPNPGSVVRLSRMIDRFQPDVVQTWMYHADLIGGLAARAARRGKIVWGIHNSTLDPKTTHLTTRWVVAASAHLSSRLPDRIVCVSCASRELHVAAGYDDRKFTIIPNGFDLEEYRMAPAYRRETRAALGVDESTVLIGLVARVDPQKDHLNFVRAAALLRKRHAGVRFLLCGNGATILNEKLAAAIAQSGLEEAFLLLGRRDDVPQILNSLDIASLSSAYGEAFPLVIGEAMACGVPCVVTDLGDCARLVGDTGHVVPPRDPEALAAAWDELVRMGSAARQRMGLAARSRIESSFSLSRVAAEYAAVYREVIAGDSRTATRAAGRAPV